MPMGFSHSIAGDKYEEYKNSANEVVHFKLVRQESEMFDDDGAFKPDMTHQVFGDSETIFGYRDLRINIYCTAARMKTYVNVKYSDKVPTRDGLYADDVMSCIREKLQIQFTTSLDDFLAALPKDANFKPFGELMNSYTVTKDGQERKFEIYKTEIEAPSFREYHKRLQPFLLFYVDAASYIDVDDDRWEYYLLFEKYQSNGNPMYAFAGYMTIYNYYAYPERVRPRISQVLVMPPFQRQGHGAHLIQTFYDACYARSDILDITVEDPSENFQRVRDYIDARNCAKLKSFSAEELHKGFSENMYHDAKHKLKINKKQSRRIYEILRLKMTNMADKDQVRAYRLDIKKRLNMPFQKNGRDFEKLQKALQPDELAATMNNVTIEQRMEYLQKTYEELLEDYRRVIERMAIGS